MPPASRPQWQQATALITIGAGGIATGISFLPKAPADLTSPASVPPVTLLALEHASGPTVGSDAMLRAAIVHIARHFLRLAETRSPAEMEAMIWQYASTDGTNHGPSCAAFASLTLELGSHVAGLDSWVTGGTTYPWPVHSWVDSRVEPNPASPGVVSVLRDAQNHGRWHPLGDRYTPKPGDWVLFDGHVEVVTKDHSGVLHTIGGDSLPNLSVNAHEYSGPLQDQGVAGFVDNGVGMSKAPAKAANAGGGGKHAERARVKAASQASAAPTSSAARSHSASTAPSGGPAAGGPAAGGPAAGGPAFAGAASSAGPVTTAEATGQQPELSPRAIAVPATVARSPYARVSRALPAQGARSAEGEHASGIGAEARTAQSTPVTAEPQHPNRHLTRMLASRSGRTARRAEQRWQHSGSSRAVTADVPGTGLRPAKPQRARPGEAAIPGLLRRAHKHHPGAAGALPPYHRHEVPQNGTPLPGTSAQQAFIKQVASGAMATQRKYGVPASVTIAQAIDESGWGQSVLATNDHNLFGIKGTGPAGSDEQPTQEVINGQLVNLSSSFQIYQNIAQSIDAHARLLARSGDYAHAMSQSKDPNAFAGALTGIYATDPQYGAKLVQLMTQYDLYRFDRAAARGTASGTASGGHAHATHSVSRPKRPTDLPGARQPGGDRHPAHSPLPQPAPDSHGTPPGRDRKPSPPQPGPSANPVPGQPAPIANPVPEHSAPAGRPVPGQPAPIAHPIPGQPALVGNPVPGQPGPQSRAHGAKPARGAQTGAGVTAQQAGTPRPRHAADRAQPAQHEAATHPAATLYPGRSARPAPLAHPVRPTDLARTSGPAPSHDPGAAPHPAQAQQPGRRVDPVHGPSPSQTAAGNGQSAGPVSAGRVSPGTSTGPGLANMSADAAIPGVPHANAARAGHVHARRPISRLRPSHPPGGVSRPAARAYLAGPTAPGNAPGSNSGAQPATAPAVQPPQAGLDPARTPHASVPAAAAPTGGKAGGAVIPGLQHHGLGANVPAGWSGGGAAASDSAAAATGQPGGSSIPGAQQSASTGSMSQAAAVSPAVPPGQEALAPSHTAAAPRRIATAPSGPAAPSGHAASAPGHPAAAPAHAAAAPGRTAAPSAHAAAPSAHAAAPSAHAAAPPSHAPAAPGGAAAARGATPAPAARAPAAARTGTRAASPLPAPANPMPGRQPGTDHGERTHAGRRGCSWPGPEHARHGADHPGRPRGRFQRRLACQRGPARQLFPCTRQLPGEQPGARRQRRCHADRVPRAHAAIGPRGIRYLGQDAAGPRRAALP